MGILSAGANDRADFLEERCKSLQLAASVANEAWRGVVMLLVRKGVLVTNEPPPLEVAVMQECLDALSAEVR